MVMDYYVPGGTAATPVDWSTIDAQALTPYEQYRSQALGQLGGMGRYAPRFETAAMRGFAPTYGRYLLENIAGAIPGVKGAYTPGIRTAAEGDVSPETWQSAWDQPFSQYVAEAPRTGYQLPLTTTGPTAGWETPTGAGWADLVRTSRAYRGGTGDEAVFDPGANYMSTRARGAVANQPVATQIGMAQAAMGQPTRGILGQLVRSGLMGQLGRYRTAIADPESNWFGRPEGGFAGWLGGRLPTSETGYVPIPAGGTGTYG